MKPTRTLLWIAWTISLLLLAACNGVSATSTRLTPPVVTPPPESAYLEAAQAERENAQRKLIEQSYAVVETPQSQLVTLSAYARTTEKKAARKAATTDDWDVVKTYPVTASDPAMLTPLRGYAVPEAAPLEEATAEAAEQKTAEATAAPIAEPIVAPTAEPTVEPAEEKAAAVEATAEPTVAPTAEPTIAPTAEPTAAPTAEPTAEPAEEKAAEVEATAEPTAAPDAPVAEESAAKPAKLYVNGVRPVLENAIEIKDGLAYVPLSEALSFFNRVISVEAAGETLTAQDTDRENEIVLTADSDTALVNGNPVKLTAAPYLNAGGTMLVELSSFRTLFDADNKYMAEANSVYITESGLC